MVSVIFLFAFECTTLLRAREELEETKRVYVFCNLKNCMQCILSEKWTYPNLRPHTVRLFAFCWSLTGSSTVHIFGHASGILADFAAANDIIANLAKTTEPVIEIHRRCSSNFIFVVWNVWYDARETYFFKHEVVILSFRCNFSTEFQREEGRTIGIVNKINETTVTKSL